MYVLLWDSQSDIFFASMIMARTTPVPIHNNPVTRALVDNLALSITRPIIIVITVIEKISDINFQNGSKRRKLVKYNTTFNV